MNRVGGPETQPPAPLWTSACSHPIGVGRTTADDRPPPPGNPTRTMPYDGIHCGVWSFASVDEPLRPGHDALILMLRSLLVAKGLHRIDAGRPARR